MNTTADKLLTPDQLAGLACVVCGCMPKVAIPFQIETPTSSDVFRCETCSADPAQVAGWVAYSAAYVIIVGYPRERLAGMILQGPRPPAEVKRSGYGFTRDLAQAWPFPNEKQGQAKARILERHMGWGEGVLVVETRSEAAANLASEQ